MSEVNEGFIEVTECGSLTKDMLADGNKELYLFRIPTGLLNPSDLVNQKISLNYKKGTKLNLRDMQLEVSLGDIESLNETRLFLPEEESGKLVPADIKFTNQIMIRGSLSNNTEVENAKNCHTNIEKVFLEPPQSLKRRDFFSNGTDVSSRSNKKLKTESYRKKKKKGSKH